MADQLKLRGGSEDASKNFTGAAREVTVDTTEWTLRVHDGVTAGGHKLLKSGNCLVVEEADKCDPNKPTCLVTVNGQLVVEGDTEFKGDVVFDNGLNGVDDSMIDLEISEPAEGCGGPGCCISGAPELNTVQDKLNWLQKALYQLEACHCNLKDASEIADGLLQKEIERVEQLIKSLELQIKQLQNEVAQNTLDIALLKKEIDRLDNNIDAVQYCCESGSKPCLTENGGLEYNPDTNCLQINWLHDPRGK